MSRNCTSPSSVKIGSITMALNAPRSAIVERLRPFCEAPRTESNPACNALPDNPGKVSGLYPRSIQADPKFCTALEKRADAERTARLASEASAKKAELTKRAAEFAHIPGNVKSVLKVIDTLPAAEREEALQALKAQDAQLSAAFKSLGSTGTPSPEMSSLEAIAKRIKSEQPSLTIEQAMSKALDTPEGSAAYAKSIGL